MMTGAEDSPFRTAPVVRLLFDTTGLDDDTGFHLIANINYAPARLRTRRLLIDKTDDVCCLSHIMIEMTA